jgi:hypothetical protein
VAPPASRALARRTPLCMGDHNPPFVRLEEAVLAVGGERLAI